MTGQRPDDDPRKRTSGPAAEPGEGLSTRAVHAGGADPVAGEPVVPPLVQSVTFFGWGPGGGPRRYGRLGNTPNNQAVAAKVAALEGTETALLLSSGMAATATSVLALTEAGDHVVASRDLYGTTRSFLETEMPRRGVDVTLVDAGTEAAWAEAVRPRTRILFLEIPTNPTLRVFDPRPAVRVAREGGAALLVDATFASPVNLRAAEHGADLVIHSATKYLGGHSDLLAGVVAGPSELVDRIRRTMILYGAASDPHTAWLLERSLRTLSPRVERQNASALALARRLEAAPGVARVLYPGLESHPDHATASRLMDGFGGMLSLILEGGGAAADAFMEALRIAVVAPSLGGVETLVSQPRLTSHVHLSPEERSEAGIPDGFVRISVGVEDPEDLERDFLRALEGC